MTTKHSSAKTSFAQSRKRDPQILTGETAEMFKSRILDIVEVVATNGLTTRNRITSIGIDLEKGANALATLTQNDYEVMDHANDPLVKQASNFLKIWAEVVLPLGRHESKQEMHSRVAANAGKALSQLHATGLDVSIQPRRWDNCHKINGRNGQVSSQCSLFIKG